MAAESYRPPIHTAGVSRSQADNFCITVSGMSKLA